VPEHVHLLVGPVSSDCLLVVYGIPVHIDLVVIIWPCFF
jgi:hypothetical protein